MEIWDVLDESGNKTGKTIKKGEPIPKGVYHVGADIWIINSENKILIQKRAPQKKLSPNLWAMTGGSVIKGETPMQTIERETEEELGIKLNMKNVKFLTRFRASQVWVESFVVKQDINLDDIKMQEDEVSEVKWATFEEIEDIYTNNNFIEERWEYISKAIKPILKDNI